MGKSVSGFGYSEVGPSPRNIWASSSAGRATPLHGVGSGFKSCLVHQWQSIAREKSESRQVAYTLKVGKAQREIDSSQLVLRRKAKRQNQLLSSVLKFVLETIWRTAAVRFEVISVVNTGLQTQDMMEGAGLEKNPTERKLRRCRLPHKKSLIRKLW